MAEDTSLSGEIVSAAKAAETAAAAPTQQDSGTAKADASTRETPATEDNKYKGWIPPDAHERVVDGFHKRLDAVAWASGLSREEVEDALALRRREAAKAKQSDEPQPDVKDERGEWFYSVKQGAAWADWKADQREAAIRDELDKRLGPIEASHEQSERMTSLTQQIAAAKAWPKFADHIEPITKAIRDAREAGQPISLHEAYIRVVAPKLADVDATREADLKKKWLDELNHTSDVVKDDLHSGKRPSATRKDPSTMSIKELTAAAFKGEVTASR